jgi:hypothetical protein
MFNKNKLYNKNIENIGKMISIESKVNIVGSASIKRSLYYSDYDLFEQVHDKDANSIYIHFLALFNKIKVMDNIVISDFKLGGLKWTFHEITRGVNNGVSFNDALKEKSIIKIDIISLINGKFYEISEVYKICLNGQCNMDYDLDVIIKDITDEYTDKVQSGDYMKALKKMYSIIKLNNSQDSKLNLLLDYFNSPIGLLYRNKSELETMLIVIENDKFNIDEIKNSLEILKEQISAFPVPCDIDKIVKLKTKKLMIKPIMKQIRLLNDYLNRDANKFLNKYKL